MNIVKMLAEKPVENEERTPPLEEDSEYELSDLCEDEGEDLFMAEAEDAAVSEILDAFQSRDAKALRTALKSFVQMCRDQD